jgi:5'-AMP-activated protein kinase beta subunit, interaction domain/Glycogen recognition site of AMP-activated protein kinase
MPLALKAWSVPIFSTALTSRLFHSEKGEGMTATIGFPPGTHHLKFIVDGEMVPSPDLPTTVDIHNVLVNYIEVVADEPPRGRRESGQKTKVIPPEFYPPIVLPEEEDLDSEEEVTERAAEPLEEEIPIGDFRQLMPQALTDMDLSEDDTRFRQAYNIIHDTPGPPSLPLFLGKSILNGVLPHKDDNSVLTLPNHTVLNHLATSSIKNGVLATSVTTRYKKKVASLLLSILPHANSTLVRHHDHVQTHV